MGLQKETQEIISGVSCIPIPQRTPETLAKSLNHGRDDKERDSTTSPLCEQISYQERSAGSRIGGDVYLLLILETSEESDGLIPWDP